MSFRDGPFNDLKVPMAWTAAVAVVVAIVVGVALLLSDRRETLQTHAYGVGRQVFDTADKPVSSVLGAPAHWARQLTEYVHGYLFAVSENRRLKQQIADLKQWRDVAVALQDTNLRYKAILGLKTDPPIPMVTGRVVLDTRGPFANTRLANVGAEKGVKVGNPVMSDRGLVGRVVGVTHGASRVLLLTDVASRTPVLIDRTDARAILLGDGGSNPRLAYLRGQDPVKEGDRILTSGDGGVFPRGLPVGFAAKGLDGAWRVRLDSDLNAIDFIRVLEFQDFTSLVSEKDMEHSPMPPLESAQSEQASRVKVAAGGVSLSAQSSAPVSSSTPAGPPASSAPAKPGRAATPAGAAAKPATHPARKPASSASAATAQSGAQP